MLSFAALAIVASLCQSSLQAKRDRLCSQPLPKKIRTRIARGKAEVKF
ncbi:hypothetical protein CAMRE0001_2713 [Campylobacter rectus RM3267]|uniref:Uncharacterized protein n=1 Tax=Campylobacter rectus RM3267 TaxID=553218 RepID=B9D0R7_CAMRE|nr:hypothetical protein CAMRE0001_2713 [Campylobacter rectus RM3267]